MKEKRLKVRSTVGYILVAMVIAVMVTACGSRKELERDVEKKEMPLWLVLRHKRAGMDRVFYKDKWFAYDVDLEYIKGGPANTIIASCPVAQARFTVTDRVSGDILSSVMVNQSTCEACHPR
ncbi:MAG: hypothetical protein GY721_07345 [Deltaproteobacteria bacterium]|nr:hypothetical protein [Deltaproteobacteria bacterium]